MYNAEFQQYFGHFSPEETQEIANKWLGIPTYVHLPKPALQKVTFLTTLEGRTQVKDFVDYNRTATNSLVQDNRHFEAIDLLNQRSTEAEQTFSGDDLLTVRRYAFYRRGYVQEHLATFGPYSKLELGHPMRTVCFLSAARDYMLADLELGTVSDYGLRASECFGGARISGLQMAALGKCFGSLEGITLVSAKSPNMVIVKDLMRRATETVDLAPVPGSKNAVVITGEYPDPQLN